MSDLEARIREHWAKRGDLAVIEAGLVRRGLRIDDVTFEDLAVYDQLHAGVLDATRELARWADIVHGEDVLDVGAGLGGTARYLAGELGCHVTALELSPELDTCGRTLTSWLGLTERVVHVVGDALSWECDWTFDVVLLQHADLHVEDKVKLYGRCRRVLSSAVSSRVVWHDFLAGPGGPLVLPVPWSSEDEEITFLATMDELRASLVAAGLALHRFKPLPAETALWFNGARDRLRKVLDKPEVEDRGRLESRLAEIEGGLRNLAEQRIVPFFAEARRVE